MATIKKKTSIAKKDINKAAGQIVAGAIKGGTVKKSSGSSSVQKLPYTPGTAKKQTLPYTGGATKQILPYKKPTATVTKTNRKTGEKTTSTVNLKPVTASEFHSGEKMM